MANAAKDDVIPFEEYRLPPVGHAVSGAVGSTIANLFIYPLDISTTRLQLENKTKKRGLLEVIKAIYKNEGGLRGLYAGLGADTLATVLSSFIYFYCYTALRNVQEKFNTNMGKKAQLNVAQELFLGAEAALISRLFTTPVSNVTTRLQTAGKDAKGFTQTVRDIYKEKGILGFWTGYRASILLVSNPSITYFVLEKAKALYLRAHKKTSLSPLEVFFVSALAKTVATMVTYPFIFVRTSMVAHGSDVKGKGKPVEDKKGMIAFMQHVIKRDGPAGLYKGMRAQITKGFFNQGIMYMIKDRVANYLALAFYTSMIIKRRTLQQ
ncbi:mitochondrial carrier domain-containing protein [Fennellomyces sp. T-0311]|nr:mitochondrial carrier domain-containing protein [Fennellomyces sp. T-0311]